MTTPAHIPSVEPAELTIEEEVQKALVRVNLTDEKIAELMAEASKYLKPIETAEQYTAANNARERIAKVRRIGDKSLDAIDRRRIDRNRYEMTMVQNLRAKINEPELLLASVLKPWEAEVERKKEEERKAVEAQRQQRVVAGRGDVAVAVAPVAGGKVGHAVEHRAHRSQTEGGEDDKPEEDAEDMTVRRQQRVFDDMAQHLGARQFAGIEVAPFGQQPAGLVFVTARQRVADVGEVVAELPKAQREVEQPDIEGQRQHQAEVADEQMQGRHQHRGYAHRHAPHHPGVVGLPGVEIAARPAHP